MAQSDPYLLVRDEISSSLKSLHSQLYEPALEERVSKGKASNALEDLGDALDTTESEIKELDKAVVMSRQQPERFHLTLQVVKGRTKEVDELKQEYGRLATRLDDLRSALHISSATKRTPRAPAGGGLARGGVPEGSSDVDEAHHMQMVRMREQDEHLGEIEMAATRIGRLGMDLSDELGQQSVLLEGLDNDVDTAQGRLQLVRKMMHKLEKKMGKFQYIVLAVLLGLLIILIAIAFN